MAMKKVMVSLPEEMVKILENERKERYLETIPETIRVILSDYLRNKAKRNNSR
jgi:metal-responsive CopG/Arc/MetJ family transcriptional regulator